MTTNVQTRESQAALSPDDAIRMLVDGNGRFVAKTPLDRNSHEQIAATAEGQHPFAVVLSCIDSRVPVELVFDQGVGDIFTARVAGSVINEDLLGSMEFACKLAGSKAILVLGHTSCGAVKGAIAKARLGNLTSLVQKIEPVVEEVAKSLNSEDPAFANTVAEASVVRSIQAIRDGSTVLAEMESSGEVKIVGAMYDVSSGKVRFL